MLFSYNPIYLPKILQIGTKANKSMRQFISAVKDNCYISSPMQPIKPEDRRKVSDNFTSKLIVGPLARNTTPKIRQI